MNYELIGWIVTAISALPVVGSGITKVIGNAGMIKNMEHVGFSRESLLKLGIVELITVATFLVPQTSFIGQS